jgi:hypothetical protein
MNNAGENFTETALLNGVATGIGAGVYLQIMIKI